MFVDEFKLFTEVIMPFLREHWHEIDLSGGASGESDGHLTRAELEAARVRLIARGDEHGADILADLLMRYEAICAAFVDGGGSQDETALGISRHDISVYAQLWDPDYRKRDGQPVPFEWMSQKDVDDGKYW
ncbi:MAG: hypothetical protein QG625_793 [Cyanobacteriota bacterium erpe_2018_sw_39hr_WHONDRS-SW48-000098_B_bin.30]|nr:hypothetical protein [Cyanobacteriota bacterium erpe_2018_sw_39hr_WHONDRS-SW48-000098_B_bin.30]